MTQVDTPAAPAGAAVKRIKEWIEAHSVLVRWLLAGPVTIVATLLVLAGMVFWVPEGQARLNNVALPVILMPLVWAALFFYACLDQNLTRATAVLMGVILVHALIVWVGV